MRYVLYDDSFDEVGTYDSIYDLRKFLCDRKYDEILERLDALERKVSNSKLLMKRTLDGEYERLVDVVVEHDRTITEIVEHTVGTLSEGDDANW